MKNWQLLVYRSSSRIRTWRGYARARLWSARGAKVGRRVAVHEQCHIDRPWGVHLGERVCLEPRVYLNLSSDSARLNIGGFVFVGAGTRFDVLECIEIGSHTLIAPGCVITDHDHNFQMRSRRIDQQNCVVEHVVIGSDVWLGAGVVVLRGVVIGDGAVVGAGAVVRQCIPAYSIAAGIPAKLIGQRKTD